MRHAQNWQEDETVDVSLPLVHEENTAFHSATLWRTCPQTCSPCDAGNLTCSPCEGHSYFKNHRKNMARFAVNHRLHVVDFKLHWKRCFPVGRLCCTSKTNLTLRSGDAYMWYLHVKWVLRPSASFPHKCFVATVQGCAAHTRGAFMCSSQWPCACSCLIVRSLQLLSYCLLNELHSNVTYSQPSVRSNLQNSDITQLRIVFSL